MISSFRTEKEEQVSAIFNSTISQATSYFSLQEQMIIKQNIIVEKLFFQEDISTLNWAQNNTIENAIQLVERRNELINFGWSLDTVDDFIAIANPWRVHKSVLSEEETNIGRKIIALGSFWQTSMEQEFGLDGSLKVT